MGLIHITVITKTAIIRVNFENYEKIKLIPTILLEIQYK